jgi:hypothetical protein
MRRLIARRRGLVVAAAGVLLAAALFTSLFVSASAQATTLSTFPRELFAEVDDVTATSAFVSGQFIPAGLESEYRLEYTAEPGNSGSWAPVPGGSGTILAADASDERRRAGALLTGLKPATSYYVRLHARNEPSPGHPQEATSASAAFKTAGPPSAITFATHAIHGEALRVLGSVEPGGSPTNELQSVTVGGGATGGSFKLCLESQCTGATGTGAVANGSKEITALSIATGTFLGGEEVSGAGIPAGARIVGLTVKNGVTTALKLSAAATESKAGVALTANLALILHEDAGENNEAFYMKKALEALPNVGETHVVVRENFTTTTYTVMFVGPLGGRALPQITANAEGLTPSGTVSVATLLEGAPFAVHYRAQYVSQEDFANTEWASAEETPELEGSGLVGADLPALTPGETYHVRLLASNAVRSALGSAQGAPQTLTMPMPPAGGSEACANEALRSGPSAHLPDCRAYEQVTPVNKEGALDVFQYGAGGEASLVGEDGEGFMLHAAGTQWGSSPDPSESNYFFTRTAAGWRMTSARPQGEAGPDKYVPQIFSPDLSSIGLEVEWNTTIASKSPNVEFKTGPPGGPYTEIASIPRAQLEGTSALAGMSADASKFVLQTADHALLGHPTGTASGDDLYEFSGGVLRQVNVAPGGGKISACGAKLVKGFEGYRDGHGVNAPSHAVSADGSRVFFEDNCAHHLYARFGGVSTVDIGEYVFLAANADGSKLLLERVSGEAHDYFLYEAAAGTVKPLFSTHEGIFTIGGALAPVISDDLSAIYFAAKEPLTPDSPPLTSETGSNPEDLYRYDVSSATLQFVAQIDPAEDAGFKQHSASPDGRYFYWGARNVAGFPGGATGSGNPQAYRYDSVEHVVQCLSCASPFDPRPKLEVLFTDAGTLNLTRGPAGRVDASANGDYVFFDTASALVPEDVNSEIAPHAPEKTNEPVATNIWYSGSSDVYEWRRSGVDGCAHLQGCLALISSGTGGSKNELLGTTQSGRDVFIATHEPLVPGDRDTAGDVYDARIGGGFPPPPPPPTECEGDACSTPFLAPSDPTPSSSTFQGAGNLPAPAPVAQGKPAPNVKPKKCRAKGKRKCKAKPRKRSAKRAGGTAAARRSGAGR